MGKRGPVPGHHSGGPDRRPYVDEAYRMWCDCGWVGEWCRRKHDADDDLIEHLAPYREAHNRDISEARRLDAENARFRATRLRTEAQRAAAMIQAARERTEELKRMHAT